MPARPLRLRLATLAAVAALSLLAPCLAARAAAKAPDPSDASLPTGERLRALIDRIKLEQSRVKTLEARFVQKQESDLLVSPEESTGVFSYAAPDRVRWEYRSPKPISVVIDGQEMTTWYHDLGRADKIKVGRYSSQVFKYMGASGSMETLVDYFRVSVKFPDAPDEPYRLKLVPKYDRIAQKLRSMTLWIDPQRFFPTRLRYVAADGDTTEYLFEDLKVNAGIPEGRFGLDLPPSVVTRNLDVGEGGR